MMQKPRLHRRDGATRALHRRRMTHRRAEQLARSGSTRIDAAVRYSGMWLVTVRAKNGVGRPV